MLIAVDEDIPHAREVFGKLGEVRTMSGRAVRAADLADADALVVRSVTRVDAGLLAGSRVRFVGTVTTGVDHIDAPWLASQGITFASAAGCNSVPVAEYVLAALLLLSRRLRFGPSARTLGVIGVGRIGSIVARWAEALGMKVLKCDPPLERQQAAGCGQTPSLSTQDSALRTQDSGLSTQRVPAPPKYVSFQQLASEADIITLHVPLTHEGADRTCDMVDAKWLGALKTGAILINTSRGDVVCEEDLAAAIDAGRLAAVVLDVWRHEPGINADLVRRVDVATPHIAGYSVESRQRAVAMIFEALAQFGGVRLESHRRDGVGGKEGSISDIAVSPSEPWQAAVAEAVLRACDIEAIDAKLRARPGGSAGSEAFDALRGACAKRHEFGAHRARGPAEGGRARRFLAEIGFAD
jgi:erythronate-4-phosphate dehydrogenase